MAEGRGGSRWTPEQIERGAAAMQDAYLATIDRFDAMNEFRVSVVAALDAVFPVGEPDTPLSAREAAEALGVHENTVRNWEARGLIGAGRLPSGVRRFSRVEVQRMRDEMWGQYAPATDMGDEARVLSSGEPDYKDQSIEQVRRWREQEAGGPDDGPVEALKELFRRHGVSVHAGYEALAHGAVAAVRAAGTSTRGESEEHVEGSGPFGF